MGMHDKTVRRRRMVLAALVAGSLVLLTATFGGAGTVQRGALEVLAPVQKGANLALKPARDAIGWVGETWDAKGERDALVRQRDDLRREVARLQLLAGDTEELRKLAEIETAGGMNAYEPVRARVIARSSRLWYSTVTIDAGSEDGLEPDMAVVNGEGLVGKISEVSPSAATVTLLTDRSFGVSALLLPRPEPGRPTRPGDPGVIGPADGHPGHLTFDLTRARLVRTGQYVVTAGTTSPRLASLFPRGLVVGQVIEVEDTRGELQRSIRVRPAADLRRLTFVDVLTRTEPTSSVRASAP